VFSVTFSGVAHVTPLYRRNGENYIISLFKEDRKIVNPFLRKLLLCVIKNLYS
jgi:hypothetical protein